MTEVVTLRIDEETKRKVKRYGLHVTEIARTAILQEIERKEREEALVALKRMKALLGKVEIERVVQYIREDREAR
jgi:post-segregation antitoxin (ccd killing protein)